MAVSEAKKQYVRAWKARNPERMAILAARSKTPEARAAKRAYSRTPARKARIRALRLKYKYGITVEQREALFAAQGYCCAICRTTSFGVRGPMVDHDHSTGRVRGILCLLCNYNMGWIDKHVIDLQRIERYRRTPSG